MAEYVTCHLTVNTGQLLPLSLSYNYASGSEVVVYT